MATMGKYCKAYSLKRLREFGGWTEKAENARTEREEEVPRQLTDDATLYVQENYVVADGIFKDENVIFDDVTPAWIEYCQQVLKFEIPAYEPIEIAEDAKE